MLRREEEQAKSMTVSKCGERAVLSPWKISEGEKAFKGTGLCSFGKMAVVGVLEGSVCCRARSVATVPGCCG